MLMMRDVCKSIISLKNKVIYIDHNMERLSHRLHNMISQTYVDKTIKIRNTVTRDYEKNVVDKYYTEIDKYLLLLL